MKKKYYYRIVSMTVMICFLVIQSKAISQPKTAIHSDFLKLELSEPEGTGKTAVESNIDTSLGSRILASMNLLYDRTLTFNKHGVSASVLVPGQRQWNGSVGFDYASTPMDTNLLCEAGSITKTFVAALILKLQDSGKLSIKDSIYKWLPRHYPNVDSGITIEMLLNHSSGIYDYINDDSDQTVLYDQYQTEPSKVWTADTILLNYVKAPIFKPGTNFQYSNTNYVVLGVIAQRVGGASLRDLLHKNFIDPLKLSKTFVGGVDTISYDFSHNWSAADSKYPSTDLSFIDKTAQLTGSPGDGNVCSTPSDLARWVRALYIDAAVVSPLSLRQMEKLNKWKNGLSYGLGTQLASYYSKNFYGHSGGMIGFSSAAFANPKDSVCIAVFVNWEQDPSVQDVYLNDYLIAILDEIYKPSSSVTSFDAQANDVSVYPNPAIDKAVLAISSQSPDEVTIELYSPLGIEVNTSGHMLQPGKNQISLDVSRMHTGVYFYRIRSGSHMWNGKFLVKTD